MKSLYVTYNLLNQLEELSKKYSIVKNKIFKYKNSKRIDILFKSKRIMNIIFILFIIMFAFMNDIFRSISRFLYVFLYIAFFSVLFLVARKLILFIISKTSKNIKFLNEYDIDEVKKLEYELDILTREYSKISMELKNSDIPQDYRRLDIVKWFIKAYENKRADNIKELINLYENEKITLKQNNKMQELINENKNLNNKLDYMERKFKRCIKVK